MYTWNTIDKWVWPLADVEEHWTIGSSPNMKETAALITKTQMPSASNNDSDQMIDPGGFQGSSTGLLHESISPKPRSPRPSFRCTGAGSQMSQKRSPGRMNVLRPNPLSRQDSGTVSEFENIVSAFLVTKKNPLLTKIKDQNRRALAEIARRVFGEQARVRHPGTLLKGHKGRTASVSLEGRQPWSQPEVQSTSWKG